MTQQLVLTAPGLIVLPWLAMIKTNAPNRTLAMLEGMAKTLQDVSADSLLLRIVSSGHGVIDGHQRARL